MLTMCHTNLQNDFPQTSTSDGLHVWNSCSGEVQMVGNRQPTDPDRLATAIDIVDSYVAAGIPIVIVGIF